MEVLALLAELKASSAKPNVITYRPLPAFDVDGHIMDC